MSDEGKEAPSLSRIDPASTVAQPTQTANRSTQPTQNTRVEVHDSREEREEEYKSTASKAAAAAAVAHRAEADSLREEMRQMRQLMQQQQQQLAAFASLHPVTTAADMLRTPVSSSIRTPYTKASRKLALHAESLHSPAQVDSEEEEVYRSSQQPVGIGGMSLKDVLNSVKGYVTRHLATHTLVVRRVYTKSRMKDTRWKNEECR